MSSGHDANHANLEQLREELTAGAKGVDRTRLRDLVGSIVDNMRSEGAPPERVVIAVKSAIVSSLGNITAPDPAKRAESEKLLKDCLGWCLERYYVVND